MIPFFSPQTHRKEQVAGRAVVTVAALLFLFTALFSALPSRDQLADLLEESGLSGYSRTQETTPARPYKLEEFYDRPLTRQESQPAAVPESEAAIAQIHFDQNHSSGGVKAKIA